NKSTLILRNSYYELYPRCRTLKTSIMFSVYAEKRNLIESTKEFNWKNRRIGVILRDADVQTKITEVVLSLRVLAIAHGPHANTQITSNHCKSPRQTGKPRNQILSQTMNGVSYNGNELERRGCSGALLDMLAEVASQTLHSDPSVKKPRNQRAPCRSRSAEGEAMDLEQLQSLTANHLLKLFSEFDGDEIRRTFTFTCFIEPEHCRQQFSSFGSEGKARQQMKSHLLEHVQQLELKAE
ncbi:hypothetical protein L9F63_010267, partial [Diploptera punctata]